MSTSESTDSDLESDPDDFESQYISAAGEGVLQPEPSQQAGTVVQDKDSPEDQLEKFQKTIEDTARNSGKTEVNIYGSQPTVNTGPRIFFLNNEQLLKKIIPDNIPPTDIRTFEDGQVKRLEKIVGGIRDYYHTNLMVFSPLPWVHLRSSVEGDFCVELVIKQISNGGRDVR